MALSTFEDLSNRVFRIPINQRGYAWKRGNFEALIRDMEVAENLPVNKKHYVGPIVVEDTGQQIQTNRLRDLNIVSLEDGQQRVTTLMIVSKYLSSRLLNEFHPGSPEWTTGNQLEECYKYTPAGAGGDEPLLQNLNVNFDLMIKHILIGGAVPALNSPPLNRLNDMKTIVEGWVSLIPKTELQRWAQRVMNSLLFSLIGLTNVNKFLAFDAINSRGISLSILDKVKNFCCLVYDVRGIGGSAPERKWILALEILQAAGCQSQGQEDTFISDLFSVHHRTLVRPREVHEKMVEVYGELLYNPNPILQARLVSFVEEWDLYAKSFGFVQTGDRTPFYPAGADPLCNADAEREMIRIDNLNYTDISRLLLTNCHRRFSSADYSTASSLIEKFVFRVYAVVNKKTDTHRTNLAKAASSVYYGSDVDYVKEIICYLLHLPSTGAPMSAVIAKLGNGDIKYTWANGGWDRCFYFLYEFETRIGGAPYMWINDSPTQKASMEHILPQSRDSGYWDAQWLDELEFRDHKHRLGNLVLTRDTASNAYLGQKNIHDKITDPLGRYDFTNGTNSEGQIHVHADAYGVRQWRPENILHREIKLLRWAAERWRIDCCADQDTIALPEEFQENGTHVEIAHGIPNHCIDGTEPVWPPVVENIDE